MTKRRLRLGLVGCGLWGRNILRDLIDLGHAVSVAEIDSTRRADAIKMGAFEAVANAEELRVLDGLVVSTPATTHAQVTEALLTRSVPILVEKPLTTDVASARRIARMGADRVFVGHVWRYHPGIQELAALARSGELGEIVGLRSRRLNWISPRTDVDSTWTLLPHDLSIAIAVLGILPMPQHAVAELANDRCVGLTATLGKSPWVVCEVSNQYRHKIRDVRLSGQRAVAVLTDTAIEIMRDDGALEPAIERRPFAPEPALRRELAAFCGCCAGGPAMLSTAVEGLQVVEAIAALRRLAGLSTNEA